ncbi:MAG TPA: DoxX family protein [Verrucomicrobiae bacterium]|nr:DoxX family protein [Verrucomicrobiae bacterium]
MNAIKGAYRILVRLANLVQSPLLLAMRLYWGWPLFRTGWGKLMNLNHTAEFFSSLHIPMPKLNAILAGSTECFGGLLLCLGLGSRLVSIPVAFTMVIAYVTADPEAFRSVLSDPDKFTGAAPFLFLLTALVVLAFGPGAFSVDYILGKKFGNPDRKS